MHSKNRMPWERRFGCATDGIRPERYISVNFKSVVSYGLCSQRHIKNHRRTPCFLLAYKVEQYLHQFCFWNLLITNETGGRVLENKPYILSAVLYTLFVPYVITAHFHCAWFILIWRWHRRHILIRGQQTNSQVIVSGVSTLVYTGALVYSTNCASRNCNDASRFCISLLTFQLFHTVFPHGNEKLKWKIDAISTLRIFHTPHFPHSALRNPQSAIRNPQSA